MTNDGPSARGLTAISATGQGRHGSNSAISLAADTLYIGVDDGSGRLLSFGRDFYALSSMSAEIVMGLLENPLSAVLANLTARYDAPEAQIEADVHGLISELNQRGLVLSGAQSGNEQEKKIAFPSRFQRLLLSELWRWSGSPSRITWRLLALARVACRFWGWSVSVNSWQHFLSGRQVDVANAGSTAAAERIDLLVRQVAAQHLLGMGCKERALTGWFLLVRAGLPADLVVGVNLFPLASHCWCEVNGRVYSDDAERCRPYEEIMRHQIRTGTDT